MLARIPVAIFVILLLGGCVEQGGAGHVHASKGLGTAWLAVVGGAFGTLFPDLATRWNGDQGRGVTRLLSLAILCAGTALLAAHHFDLHWNPARS